MASAKLLFDVKWAYKNGDILQAVAWQLPSTSDERPHGFKYRMYYGNQMGDCLVRYDNERGKGDHKHIGTKEFPYKFLSIRQLMADFIADVRRMRQ